MTKTKKTQAPFKQVVADLLDNSKPFSPTHLHRFSDIDPADLAALRIAWPQINPERRVSLLQDLEDLADTDTLVSYDDLARFALADPDAGVRAIAIRLLWETNDDNLIPVFIKMMQTDSDEMVRAGAAGGLGLFIYLGELEEIKTALHKKVEESLLAVYHGTDKPIVRRRAVEALGYSSNDQLTSILEESYASTDKDWQASALFAMGRSADVSWEKKILAKLDSPELEVQLEAVRATGELELQTARKPLLDMLKNPEELDSDLRAAAIWSISQIGGKGVRERLEKLAEITEDEDETYFIDEAMDNLDFKEGVGGLGILDMIPVIDEENTRIVDLSGEEEDEDEEDEEVEEEEKEEDDDFLYGTKN